MKCDSYDEYVNFCRQVYNSTLLCCFLANDLQRNAQTCHLANDIKLILPLVLELVHAFQCILVATSFTLCSDF